MEEQLIRIANALERIVDVFEQQNKPPQTRTADISYKRSMIKDIEERYKKACYFYNRMGDYHPDTEWVLHYIIDDLNKRGMGHFIGEYEWHLAMLADDMMIRLKQLDNKQPGNIDKPDYE